MRRLAIIGALSFAAGVAGGQNVHVVDAANGPGTNFVDLPTAVAAAASGDRLIVRPGSYLPFYVSGKALRISGAGKTQTLINGPHNAALGYDYVKIESVPAGAAFRFEGIGIQGFLPASIFGSGARLAIAGATGSVVLSDVSTGPVSAGGGTGLRIDGAQVHASRSSFAGGTAAGSIIVPPGSPFGSSSYYGVGAPGAGLQAGGALAAEQCQFFGGNGSASSTPTIPGYAVGGSALVVSGAQARVVGGLLQGGNAAALGNASNTAQGGRGIAALGAASLRLAGSAAVSGGNGSVGNPWLSHASAIDTAASATVDVHQPVVLATNGGLPFSGSGTVNLGLQPLPGLACLGTSFNDGAMNAAQPTSIFLTSANPPGSLFALFLSLCPGFSTPFPTLMLNELLLADLDFPAIVGTTDAFGAFSYSFTAAALFPGALDVPLHMQAAVIDAAQNLALMSNATVRVFK